MEIAEQLALDDIRMGVYNLLGLVYADKEDPDKSIEYNLKALDLSRKLGRKPHEMVILTALSAQFQVKEEYDEALRYIHDALQIGEEFGSPRDMGNILSVMSEIYLSMKRYNESVTIALRAWTIDSASYDIASPTALTLCVAYIHLGEKEKAEYFVRRYYVINIEKNEKSLHDSLIEMETKYETEKKEIQITSLEKERRLYVWLSVVGILLAVALGFVLWQKVKNARREKQLIATRSVLDGEMGERMRLARDLHDRLSGNLSAVKIELKNHGQSLQDVDGKLDNCIEEIRRIAHNLMPVSLQYGMKVALEDYVAQFPNVRFHFFGEGKRIGKRVEFVIYCCANELVNNSIKHSGAASINLQLVQDEKHVTLTVSDDGKGFDRKNITEGFGLKSIRDRVASCNGKMDIFASPGKGTETIIELNLEIHIR